MKPFRSLRLKFLVYFVGFMTASMLLLARSLFQQEHDALSGELRKRLALQVNTLAVQAREALETNDDLALLTTLRGLRATEDFVFGVVVQPDGAVFAHSDVRRIGQSMPVPHDAANLAAGRLVRDVGAEGDAPPRVEAWAPVVSTLRGRPERIGLVCVGVSKAPLVAAVQEAKLSAVRVGLLFALLGVVGTALIARTVTQPIGLLVEGVRRIAAGDLQHKMSLARTDEIGLLSDSFDDMTERLQQAQQKLLEQQLYEKELEVAGKIQSALLPAGPPHVEGFDIAALSVPARVVGGDFYDFVPLRDGRFAFLVADVAGKGISAGLVMAYARSAARSAFSYTSSPHDALAALNEQLLRDFDRSTFVTMLCMVLDPASRRLQIANAGHPPVLWWSAAASELRVVRLRGVALGILARDKFASILQATEIDLGHGDLVLGYSDGVNETHDLHEQLFGEDRLQRFCVAHAARSSQELLDTLRGELQQFANGCGQFDDITALALRTQPVVVDAATPPLWAARGRA
jgi:serine phosphatase RsbU (regulator of sigma subunit)